MAMQGHQISLKDFCNQLWYKNRSHREQLECYALLILLLSVPLFYFHKLIPPVRDFFFFSSGGYLNIQSFFYDLIIWTISAIISTRYFFLCKRKWSIFLGVLSANCWWMSWCTIGWGGGWIHEEGHQLYLLPVVIGSYYCLYKYRARWRKKRHTEEANRENGWRPGDYLIGAVLLFAVALTHLYLLFPKTQSLYGFYSGWFHNVQDFVYFFGLFLSNIIWLTLWFLDRENKWLYPYIAWPLTMFIFKLIAMFTAEARVTTVEQNYYFLLPPTALLGIIIWRIRKSLYVRTHRKEIRQIMAPGLLTSKFVGEVVDLIRWAKRKLLINCEKISFWKDMMIGIVLLSSWFTIKSDISEIIHRQLMLNDWIYRPYDISLISNVITDLLYIMAFSLWLRCCPWPCIRPYIALYLMMCWFVLLGDLNINPYTDSGYYMLAVGVIAGGQLWRERGYFLYEIACYAELQREDYSRQCAIIKAKKRLCLKEYEKEKQEIQKNLEGFQKGREEGRRKVEMLEELRTISVHDEISWKEWRDHVTQLRYKMEQAQKEYDYIEQYLLKRYSSISKTQSEYLEYFRRKEKKLIKKYCQIHSPAGKVIPHK